MNRRTNWENNLVKIRKHNLEADIGLHRYTMGMNHFGDLVCFEDLFQFLEDNRSSFLIYRPMQNSKKE
jgi:hypothetical protein